MGHRRGDRRPRLRPRGAHRSTQRAPCDDRGPIALALASGPTIASPYPAAVAFSPFDNAGDDRVKDWQSAGKYRDVQEFVESIPFTETREYVQAIMRNANVYRQLYGTP